MIYISINRDDNLSLSRQIYRSIKDSIISGNIAADTKLPSSRELCFELHVARNVVIECYEQLIAEGYAYSKNGSGTYISKGVVLKSFQNKNYQKKSNTLAPVISPTIASFRTGIPDLTEIPVKKWGQIYHKITLDIEPKHMDYQNPTGDEMLRFTLAKYLNRARGTDADPDNILLTNGAAQSFNLLCKLVSENEYALVENPLSCGILHTLKSNGVAVKPIRVDENGMVTDELPEKAPKLIFTTPSHQFPTGTILPASRRIDLIQYAKENNAYIVEDDYDSEFRFDGNPIESMQSLAPERVIYVGSFSKTLMPALRIGYMVLPDDLCEKMREAKYIADIHSPVLEQLTLAEFIESGSFEQHIRKMQKLYRRKRNYLINCLKKTFGEKVSVSGAAAGLHFVASFDCVKFDEKMLQKIKQSGIEITSVNKHLIDVNNDYDNKLIFGFGNMPMNKIDVGVELLSKIMYKKTR